MNVTSIQLYATTTQAIQTQIASFSLDLASHTDRYLIRNITGLDADEIVPKLYGSGQNGSKYYNMKPSPREIAMRIILNPQYSVNQTPENLRQELYKIISSYRTGQVELRFMNGTTELGTLKGLIIKFEAGLFNQVPEIQLTIRCDFPFFRQSTRTTVANLTTASTIITSASTAPHGFRMQLTASSINTFFQISKPGDGDWRFRVARVFSAGDQIYLSSEEDNKYIYANVAGSIVQLASSISLGSFWPLLFPGFNQFQIGSGSWTINSFDYYETHWGV
jgi:hypothetical protein